MSMQTMPYKYMTYSVVLLKGWGKFVNNISNSSSVWSRDLTGFCALGPCLKLWPFLVSWSISPMSPVGAWPSRESERRSERETGKPSGGTPPWLSQISSAQAQPSHWSSNSRGWHGWNLAGASRNVAEVGLSENGALDLESWKTQFYYTSRPRGVNTPALSPEQRDYKDFIDSAWH